MSRFPGKWRDIIDRSGIAKTAIAKSLGMKTQRFYSLIYDPATQMNHNEFEDVRDFVEALEEVMLEREEQNSTYWWDTERKVMENDSPV